MPNGFKNGPVSYSIPAQLQNSHRYQKNSTDSFWVFQVGFQKQICKKPCPISAPPLASITCDRRAACYRKLTDVWISSLCIQWIMIWLWINTYKNTIFRGMNIQNYQLFWCELQGYKVLTHFWYVCFLASVYSSSLWVWLRVSWNTAITMVTWWWCCYML
jgi:hypothetical protein